MQQMKRLGLVPCPSRREPRDPVAHLPHEIILAIFSRLSPDDLARCCSLVSKSWHKLAAREELWAAFCAGRGLTAVHARSQLGGWRGLFGKLFRTNLIAAPCFEGVDQLDADRLKGQPPCPWEPAHRLHLDRFSADGAEDRSFCHWTVDNSGRVFVGGPSGGVVRERPVGGGCGPCPASRAASADAATTALATSFQMRTVVQFVGLQTYRSSFLDSSPPMILSAWYAGHADAPPGKFRMQIVLRDAEKRPIFTWDTGELSAEPGTWRMAEGHLSGYPAGVRTLLVKLGGSASSAQDGFFGPRFTAVRLHFVPATR